MERHSVYISKTLGYFCYRIPALIRTHKGTLMAFCEAREKTCSDWSHSAIIGRRCINPIDHLDTWEDQFIVKESNRQVKPNKWAWIRPNVGVVTNNPVPIVDQDGNTIHLVYCEHYDQAFYCRSMDDGKTWSKSVNITSTLEKLKKQYNWTVIASRSGQSIQLIHGEHSGRLIVPFWLAKNEKKPSAHHPSEVAVIYSDDGGNTWKPGDFVPFTIDSPNETKAIQFQDGRVMLVSRSRESRRVFSISDDGAHKWSTYTYQKDLPEPMVMGSIVRLNNQLLYSLPNPIEIQKKPTTRKNLTIWTSKDNGKTWPKYKSLDTGRCAYSDLAVDEKNNLIYCLYEGGVEKGVQGPYNGLTIAKFDLQWLLK